MRYLLLLICVGNWAQVCFDPALVEAVYRSDSEFGRPKSTVILLKDGNKLHTDASVEDIIAQMPKT